VRVWRGGAQGYADKVEYALEGGGVLSSPLFPDLALPLAEVFRD